MNAIAPPLAKGGLGGVDSAVHYALFANEEMAGARGGAGTTPPNPPFGRGGKWTGGHVLGSSYKHAPCDKHSRSSVARRPTGNRRGRRASPTAFPRRAWERVSFERAAGRKAA
jgi:hypothetical protein